MKCLILGGTGMLGHRLWIHLRQAYPTWVTVRGRAGVFPRHTDFDPASVIEQIDVLRHDDVVAALGQVQPDVVINCVGLIKQHPHANDPILALETNALLPHRLAALCHATGARLIHISTDYVFSGRRGSHTEDDVSDFFAQMDLRTPDHHLQIRADSAGGQIGAIIAQSETMLRAEQPDRLLLLGDTNSALAAIMTQRMGIPVYHMEAGNRCYDRRVPEEVNRRINDHCSDVWLPYTERSRANLLREGIPGERIFVTGNPIAEVLTHYAPQVEASTILATLGLAAQGYFLVTMHRAENVDIASRLHGLVAALDQLQRRYALPVIISTHPRTRAALARFGIEVANPQLHFLDPFGLFDFVKLEQAAFCVLTDSGTVQEECCIFGIPTVTMRDVTERPETIEAGSNILSGADAASMLRSVQAVVTLRDAWTPPSEYMVPHVSQTVIKMVLGYDHWHRALRSDES